MIRTAVCFGPLLLLLVSLPGCQGDGADSSGSRQLLATGSPFDRALTQFTNTDHGLEVQMWTYAEADARIGGVLAQLDEGETLDGATEQRLRANGLRLVRVPVTSIDSIRAEFGEASMNMSTWHGEAVQWRSVLERPVPQQGIAVAMDGRVRSFRSGTFRLMLRSWTLQMEDGPIVHLELLPQHYWPAEKQTGLIARPGVFRGEHFHSMVIDVPLEAGYAYILTGEAPDVDWLEQDELGPTDDIDRRSSTMLGDDAPGVETINATRAESQQPTISAGTGPVAEAPPSFGEQVFFQQQVQKLRTLLVLIPKIPAELFPPDLRADARSPAAGDGSR